MNEGQHKQTPQGQVPVRGKRWSRGWRLILFAALAGGIAGIAALLSSSEPRAILAGLSLILFAVAGYCSVDMLLYSRSIDPVEPGEGPAYTPLPQSPVTHIHDPGSPPDKTLERTRER